MSCARSGVRARWRWVRAVWCVRARLACVVFVDFFLYGCFVRSRFVHSRRTTGVDCRELRGAARRATAFVLDAVTAMVATAATTTMTRGFSDDNDDEF